MRQVWMRGKDGKIHGVLRHMMIITGMTLTVLLCGKGAVRAGKNVDAAGVGAFFCEQADKGLEGIWHISYPAAEWEERPEAEREKSFGDLLCRVVFGGLSLHRYHNIEEKEMVSFEEEDPAFAGYVESGRFYEEHQYLLYDGGEESGAMDSSQAGLTIHTGDGQEGGSGTAGDILAAGGGAAGVGGTAAGAAGPLAGGDTLGQPGSGDTSGQSEDGVPADALFGQAQPSVNEKDGSLTCASSALFPIIGTTYRKEQLADYDYLMKHFYSVHTTTTAGRDLMKADTFLSKDFRLETGNENPQILIYHTHSQEEFADYGPDNKEATVIGIGNYLTQLLTAKGYHVIHDTSVYDLHNGKLDRNKAYTYALEGITNILQKNPSIEVILDLHRDGVNESLHLVNDVNGKQTAPIMFFNGVSQTPEGPIEYLPNPYREDNLAFSFQMQLDAAAYFPNLTRKIYLKGLRYNLHLRPRSALIEVGAQTNTYQEALNAMEPLSEVLDMVLQGN